MFLVNSSLAHANQQLQELVADDSASDLQVKWVWIDKMYCVFRSKNPVAEFVADIPLGMSLNQNRTASSLLGWEDELWGHLRTLFQLPYFKRICIIQEVAPSREDLTPLRATQIRMASSWVGIFLVAT